MSPRGSSLASYSRHMSPLALKGRVIIAMFSAPRATNLCIRQPWSTSTARNLVVHSRHLARLPKMPTTLQKAVRCKPRTSPSVVPNSLRRAQHPSAACPQDDSLALCTILEGPPFNIPPENCISSAELHPTTPPQSSTTSCSRPPPSAGIRQPLLPRSRSSRHKVPTAPCLSTKHSIPSAELPSSSPPDHLHHKKSAPE